MEEEMHKFSELHCEMIVNFVLIVVQINETIDGTKKNVIAMNI